jgi:hypothetical protein
MAWSTTLVLSISSITGKAGNPHILRVIAFTKSVARGAGPSDGPSVGLFR